MARILVVDDDSWIRLALRAILESEGHDVVEAADGDMAETVDRATPADLILLDLHMPQRDGIETLRSLRNAGRAAKVVMIGGDCALCQGDFLSMAQRLGADGVLHKPLERDDVVRALAAHLPLPSPA